VTEARLRVVLPVAVIALSVVLASLLIGLSGRVEPHPPEVQPPLVRVLTVSPEDVRFTVRTHGSVAPRTESDLVPEVAGRVVWLSPSFVPGGFFDADEPLLRLDRTDYEVRLRRAEANLVALRSQSSLADRNLARSRELETEGLLSRFAYDDALNVARVAGARLREAEAELDQVRRDLERTELRAPFAGRVREKHVDQGQFVERGRPVARLYAVDYAEVRLPIPDQDVAFLDLPLGYRDATEPSGTGLAVTLEAEFAGTRHTWPARVVRTEGEIDARSRMVHAVARVDDPYGRRAGDDRPPLAVGMFVEAVIHGRTVAGGVVLPRAALRAGDTVWVVDAEERLQARPVTVARRDGDRVVIAAGLTAGERVCLSPLEAFVDGMQVRLIEGAA
jgi:RND family efflux transporter MFP subunit